MIMIFIVISCGSPTPVTTTPPVIKKSYPIALIGSADTIFTASQSTVYSPLSDYIQTGSVLYVDSDLTSKVTFTYIKVGTNIYYSPRVDGQFFPYISGSSPPPIKK